MHHPKRTRLVASLLAHFATLHAVNAQTTWDGGGADTNINNPANWNSAGNDVLPSFTGTANVTFATGGSVATMNTNAAFGAVTLNRGAAFTIAAGAPVSGVLTIRSVNSSSTNNLIMSVGAGGTQTIEAPLHVDTTNTTNRFLTIANNNVSHTLDINGPLARTPASTADFALRFYGVAGSTTRIDGPVSNLSGLQQVFNNNAGTTWGGNLVFGGNRTSSATITIATTGTGNAPASTARLILGETPADVQTWGNITLNNAMQVVIGGTITAGNISIGGNANASATRIIGNSAENSTLTLSGGTITGNITVGGPGANDNNLGLAKAGSGTLTLGGVHTYAGPTVVHAGALALTGQIASRIVVNSGGTLSGEGSTTGSLAFGAGSSTLQFDPATEPAALTAASLSAAGATVVVSPVGAVSAGSTYSVLRLSGGTFSGAPSDVFAPGSRGATLSYANAGTELSYTAGAASAANLVWTGANVTNPTFWDLVATPNWTHAGAPDRFYSGDNVVFDDTAASSTVAIQGASLSAGNIVFNNTTRDYVVSGGVIAGSGSLTKMGSGSLTLAQTGTNTFSGPLSLNGGTLAISSLNQIGGGASTRAIALDGGALAFTGATATTNTIPVSLGSLGGGISVSGTVLNTDGTTAYQTLRLGAPITGSGALVKTGQSVLALGVNTVGNVGNSFTGPIQVDQGVLDIRNPDSLGDTSGGTTVNNANLAIFPFGQNAGVTFAAEPLVFTGSSYIRHQNDDIDSDVINTLTGPVTLSAGASLGLSAYRAVSVSSNVITATSPNVSRLVLSGNVTLGAGSTLTLGAANPVYVSALIRTSSTPQDIEFTGPVAGSGAVVAQGSETSSYTLAAPGYSGDTTVLGGTLRLGAGNSANDASTVTIASSGAKLRLEAADTVARLFVGSTQLAAGTYGATGSGAATIDDARFAGPGVLTVTSGPVTDPFVAWASGFGLAGPAAAKTADPDADGLSNVLEYATGSSPVAAGPANIAVSRSGAFLSLTYTRVADAALTYSVEGSNDLAAWTEVDDVLGANPATGSAAGQVVVIDTVPVDAPGKRFLRLKITY